MRNESQYRPLSLGEQFRIEQGWEIGRRARALYPGGVLIEENDPIEAADRTRHLMTDPSIPAIFEATFLHEDYSTKADILLRNGNSWDLIEVKSSIRNKPEFIDDMAYTAMVIGFSNTPLREISLMLVSRRFRLGMPEEDLFATYKHTGDVKRRIDEFLHLVDKVAGMTRSPLPHEPKLQYICRSCERFAECFPYDSPHHIFNLPRLNQKKFEELAELGVICIHDIPPDFPLSTQQQRMVCCVRECSIYADPDLKMHLEAIKWPAFYLDFEAFQTAIPLYSNTAPYTQIPTQYSIHICSCCGSITHHTEYLAESNGDCRRDLAKRLIADLTGEGSIIVYSGFERRIIRALARAYPDLAKDLNGLIQRLVDLEAIIRKHFYHPAFNGSTSIKKTLPALLPEMTYEGLDISEGDTAMAAFAYLANGHYSEDEAELVRKNLLEYCKQDTLAMVRLHERLVETCDTKKDIRQV